MRRVPSRLRSLVRSVLFEIGWAGILVELALAAGRGGGRVGELKDLLWLFRKVKRHTLVGIPGLKVLYRFGREIAQSGHVPGDIVECGVYNGGSAGVMVYPVLRNLGLPRRVWLLDSFAGLPEPGDRDDAEAWEWVGRCRGDVREVETVFRNLNIWSPRVKIVQGWLRDTLPSLTSEIDRIALLHLDVDWYDSTKLCLEHFYDRVVPGGVIVVDDYQHWAGCRRAVDDFIAGRRLPVRVVLAGWIGCYLRKS